MQLKRVVLPAPLGPIRPMISPCSMAKEMRLLATTPPKSLIRSTTWRNAILCPFPQLLDDPPDSTGLIGRDDHDQCGIDHKVNSDEPPMTPQPATQKTVERNEEG